ncbi:MAG: NAD-dependent epimerase/dehydratase family protein [Elusimicrobia bacterium]|nr:NAD-dependent epimerase/dehydratase family protein [Elusimicrobiota bacterium]
MLITGGLGFIGSSIAHRLVALGAQVSLLDVLLANNGGTPLNIRGIEDKVGVFYGDIRDRDLLRRLVAGQDFIFNLAGQVNYRESLANPFLDLDISCAGHLSLLEACRSVNSGARVVFASSRLVYGRQPSAPVSETASPDPLTLYGIHKLTAERYHQLYWRSFGIHTAVLRITNPYGPRQNVQNGRYGIVNWFLRLAMEGGVIRIYGDGGQKRDVIFIDDLVDAFLAAATTPAAAGQIFNAGSGQTAALREIAAAAIATAGKGRIEHVEWPAAEQQMETGDFIVDITKARRLLRLGPATTLAEGLRKTRCFYEDHAMGH